MKRTLSCHSMVLETARSDGNLGVRRNDKKNGNQEEKIRKIDIATRSGIKSTYDVINQVVDNSGGREKNWTLLQFMVYHFRVHDPVVMSSMIGLV